MTMRLFRRPPIASPVAQVLAVLTVGPPSRTRRPLGSLGRSGPGLGLWWPTDSGRRAAARQ
jgi:hypothetical protein